MNLKELKRRERELRHRLGDEQYEQMYMRQQRAEAITKPATPAYKPEISPPAVNNRTGSSFNTDRPDSGIISNKPAIADFRKGIEDLNKKIDSLNKQQYNTMLSGDDKKTAAYDGIIRNAEKQRDALKIQMARAMGIGSESAEKDMLRAGGGLSHNGSAAHGGMTLSPKNRLQFNANNMQQAIGLDDKEWEYPSEPSPSPMPGPPPVDSGHPDMENYEDRLENYHKEHEAWEKETEQIFRDEQKSDPNYKNNKLYISEEEYFSKIYSLSQNKEDPDYKLQCKALTDRRHWSRDQENYYSPRKETGDYINKKDYDNEDDYYRAMAERIMTYLDEDDMVGVEDFFKDNNINDYETKNTIGEYVKELKTDRSLQHNISPGSSDLKPLLGDLKSYGNYWDKPSMDKDNGRVYIKGKGVDIIPWSSKNSEYPYEVEESYHLQKNDFNLGRFILNLDLEENVPGWFTLFQLTGQGLAATDWFDVDVDIVKIDGQKKAIIKYTDSGWTDLKKAPGEGIYDFEKGTDITLNEKHKAPEFGYIYEEAGKTWLKPLVYPGDRYIKGGEDVTYQLKKPFEMPKELVEEINKLFLDKGLGIELP